MKCTNRKLAFLAAAALLAAPALTGCGSRQYSFAYDMDRTVSGFQMTENAIVKQAPLFAEDLCVTASDVTAGTSVDLSEAYAGGLFDLNKKNVIYAKSVHERLYPASLTKTMTALVALKYGNPEDLITVSSEAAGIKESGAQLCGLKTGDTLSLDQALHALLMYSANDAAVAVAEHIGGSVENFARMMNDEAAAIGATNCHFVNPHGLHDENHYVTAYDLYLIFNEALKYDMFTEIISLNSYVTTYRDKDGNTKTFDFSTTNQYLSGNYQPPANVTALGGKTGTTSAAHNCLILYSKDKNGSPYISVILGAKERGILYEEMNDLLSEIDK